MKKEPVGIIKRIAKDFNLSGALVYYLLFVSNIRGSNTNNKFNTLAIVRESIKNGTFDGDGRHYSDVLEDVEEDMKEIINKAKEQIWKK